RDTESQEDVRSLYKRYLRQEIAYRQLKMRKLEKEIQLLDKQLQDVRMVLIAHGTRCPVLQRQCTDTVHGAHSARGTRCACTSAREIGNSDIAPEDSSSQGNSRSGNAAIGNTGSSNADSAKAGSSSRGNHGNGNAAIGNVGSGSADNGNAASGNANRGKAGSSSGNAACGNAGSGNADCGNAGSSSTGSSASRNVWDTPAVAAVLRTPAVQLLRLEMVFSFLLPSL
ncbi:UNVERIFIED_CONTAM: hypothetical protein FKN15_002695, partial [Acipenser sinensis]